MKLRQVYHFITRYQPRAYTKHCAEQSLDQGWATPGTRAKLGTQARFCGTRASPRKRVNEKAAAEVLLTNIWPYYFFFVGHLRA